MIFDDGQCEHKEHCTSRGLKCEHCKHNKKNKKDYYTPIGPDITVENWPYADKSMPCLAEACAESIRKERGLPPGSPIPISISCPCPKCSPRMR